MYREGETEKTLQLEGSVVPRDLSICMVEGVLARHFFCGWKSLGGPLLMMCWVELYTFLVEILVGLCGNYLMSSVFVVSEFLHCRLVSNLRCGMLPELGVDFFEGVTSDG
eukprot:TRINITY_DN35780_c0_g1_i1.p1 TRINITY_DN35780_c0_g1~~TRINITY_DN35780_c0_g1_i1.p1  ORF type:complete len:110 (+),score=1.01 TRINITY_DN35780_c0_g1_i1:3-332(+)